MPVTTGRGCFPEDFFTVVAGMRSLFDSLRRCVLQGRFTSLRDKYPLFTKPWILALWAMPSRVDDHDTILCTLYGVLSMDMDMESWRRHQGLQKVDNPNGGSKRQVKRPTK